MSRISSVSYTHLDVYKRQVYYNHSQERVYVLASGTLYQVDLAEDEQTVLAENLEEGQYAVSDDGHLMAYQTDGTLYTAAALKVMNLQSGDEYTIEAADGQAVRPLGFVNSDFIYGKINPCLLYTSIDKETIMEHFPNIYQHCLEEGYDVTKECIPVVPAQHYFCLLYTS